MQKISDRLYWFKDTCNVYLIKNGTEAVVIDFGSGDILDHLHTIGVDRITDVLMTHHHRDQGQGLQRAVKRGARIWVPHQEQDLFQQVEAHWQAREVYNNYNVRQDRFSIIEPVAVEGTLRDYISYRFNEDTYTVIPTPGHTVGSLSLLLHVDDHAIVFTGDLIAAPGKVWSMAATQWTYNGAEGVAASILSLLDLKSRCPDLLLPSHGEPINESAPAIDLLIGRLKRLLELRNQYTQLLDLRDHPYESITPHFLRNRTSLANSYVLLSRSGKALMIDFGYDFNIGLAAGSDRSSRRPWLYTVDSLKRDYEIQKIDAVLPTHYHDDHVAGLNLLREVEGAEVWAAENYADLLENPSRYDLPCLWYDRIPVDRRLSLDQPVHWEEYDIQLYEQPGHTLYAIAISFEVDGKRVLAIGDQQSNDGHLWNYVYKNRFRIGDYRDSGELYLKVQPDVIVSGHWEPLWVEPGYLEMLKSRGETLEELHRELLPLEQIDLGAEGVCAWIKPYQATAKSGETIELDVEVLNPFAHDDEAVIFLTTPEGWAVAQERIVHRLSSQTTNIVTFQVEIPPSVKVTRARVAVDLTIGNHRLGQQAEALITVI